MNTYELEPIYAQMGMVTNAMIVRKSRKKLLLHIVLASLRTSLILLAILFSFGRVSLQKNKGIPEKRMIAVRKTNINLHEPKLMIIAHSEGAHMGPISAEA